MSDEKPSRVSEESREMIRDRALALFQGDALPSIKQIEDLVAEVAEAEIDKFCDSFGRSAAELALFLVSMSDLTEQVRVANAENDGDEDGDPEGMKLVLTGQALEQCTELAHEVLAHVDVSNASVEMIDVGKLN